jgi:hypothetical protein
MADAHASNVSTVAGAPTERLGSPVRFATGGARPLTDRQAEVLRFVVTFQRRNGCAPTLREIGNALDIRSTNGVNDHLLALERKGAIRRRGMKSRGIVVLADGGERDDVGAGDVDGAAVDVVNAVDCMHDLDRALLPAGVKQAVRRLRRALYGGAS